MSTELMTVEDAHALVLDTDLEVNSAEMAKSPEEQIADKLKIEPWARVLIKRTYALAIVFALAIFGLYAYMFSMKGDIGDLQGQLKNFPATMSQNLIEHSKLYTAAGENDKAAKALRLANEFLAAANDEKLPSDKTYFKTMSDALNRLSSVPELKPETTVAMNQLASYRSSLKPEPIYSESQKRELESSQLVSISKPSVSPADFQGKTVLVFTKSVPDMFDFGVVRKLSNGITFENLVFYGAVPGVSQTLDGARWTDVTFVNINVRYQGDELALTRASFINCTFDIVNDSRGFEVANYVAVPENPNLVISQANKESRIPGGQPANLRGPLTQGSDLEAKAVVFFPTVYSAQ